MLEISALTIRLRSSLARNILSPTGCTTRPLFRYGRCPMDRGGYSPSLAVLNHDDAFFPSPDGKWIARQSEREGIVVQSADGATHRVIHGPGEGEYLSEPAWSPDSRLLIYTRCRLSTGIGCAENVLEIASPDGSAPVQIYSSSSYSPVDFVWLPDNRVVFLESEYIGTAAHFSLYTIRIDTLRRAAGQPDRLLSSEEGDAYGLSRTDAGNRIAFVRRVSQTDVTIGELSPDKTLRLEAADA